MIWEKGEDKEEDEMVGKSKEELSPKAKGYKKTYERWFYGVLIGFIMAGGFGRVGSPLLILPLAFAVYCLYQSQKNYSLYKRARAES
jgi:hypothetical protein